MLYIIIFSNLFIQIIDNIKKKLYKYFNNISLTKYKISETQKNIKIISHKDLLNQFLN
jgi:hypothetical protein